VDVSSFERPHDTDVLPVIDAVLWQRDYVASTGADVAAQILEAVRADLAAGGVLADLSPQSVRFGDLVGLRYMAAVHRLALGREAPAVALHLPTLGGTPPREADRADFADAVVSSLAAHPDVLAQSLAQTPQTNEVGRAALLRCALSRLPIGLPVRLREIGCSAGLNLRADRLPGVIELEAGPLPEIQDRIGCDLDPVDPTTTEGRVHLTSYIWVDQVARFERLRNALEVAASCPAEIVRLDAASFVESLHLVDGTTTVLWHSAMWPYVTSDQRARILAGLERLGAGARERRQLAHVSWEWCGEPVDPRSSFELVMRTWRGTDDDGRAYLLARGGGHGNEPFLVDGAPVALSAEPLPA
jgi:hypothetical protein